MKTVPRTIIAVTSEDDNHNTRADYDHCSHIVDSPTNDHHARADDHRARGRARRSA